MSEGVLLYYFSYPSMLMLRAGGVDQQLGVHEQEHWPRKRGGDAA